MVFFKFNLWGRRIAFYARKVERVKGVNSNLAHGGHMPMLDIEGTSLRQVIAETRRIQDMYNLGPAQIFESGRPDHWHVYYLTVCTWKRCIQLACQFEGVDPNHLVWSLKRKHFTLRFSTKGGRPIAPVALVEGAAGPTAFPEMLRSFVEYETAG